MKGQTDSWERRALLWVVIACVQFVVLTFLAMLFYRGGTAIDPTTSGYSFTHNFFSELGRTEAYGGQPNTLSASLFVVAMTLAGFGLVLFFVVFLRFFRHTLAGKVLGGMGSVCGVLSGLCFVGVALTPANLFLEAHGLFVLWAFRLFPLAVMPYIVAMVLEKRYPNRYALAFAGFAALLVGYLVLMTRGPSAGSAEGRVIQVVGQKVIGYASVISVFIEAQGARKILGG
jgi:hypothetical membrane protein